MTRGRHPVTLVGLALAAILSASCGSESTPPRPDTGAAADLAAGKELGAVPEGGVKPDGAAKPDGASAGKTVLVIYGTASTPVDVSKPTQVPLDGTTYSRLSDVVLLALPGKDLSTLKLTDFEAADGFKPSTKANCVGLIPLPAEKLAKGYVQPLSLNVRWDDDLGFPSCMAPKSLAKILLADK